MGDHVYVERADPDTKGYEPGTRRWTNVISRYTWANHHTKGYTIDMPCGMGWGTSLITNSDLVMGIDISEEAIDRAKTLFPGVHFMVQDMLRTLFPNNYADTIICCEGYEHVKRSDQFVLMDEIHRISKPDATVLLTIPCVEKIGDHSGNQFHLYEPTVDEVKDTFSDKFQIVEILQPNIMWYRLRTIK